MTRPDDRLRAHKGADWIDGTLAWIEEDRARLDREDRAVVWAMVTAIVGLVIVLAWALPRFVSALPSGSVW